MIKTNDLAKSLTAAIGRVHQASSDFDLNSPIDLPKNRVLRPAAVLIAVQQIAEVPHVILTQRASTLKHHAGQVAFPGGKCDEGDENIEHTALREADEEIGLRPANVQIIGRMPTHETVTGYSVTPVIGLVRDHFTPILDQNEVAEIFTCPLSHVTNINSYLTQSRRWGGQQRHYYTVPYGPYYIWGATARILWALATGVRG